jgi:transcriptional regulator with XRE-family HTH domain
MLARKLAGLSIREAADLCELGRGAWTKWENGSRPLDLLDVTAVIAERLDVDLEWLRFGGPLEGPRGREIRQVTKRPTSDTFQYHPSSVRPMGSRPSGTHPKTRAGTGAPRRDRPVVISG